MLYRNEPPIAEVLDKFGSKPIIEVPRLVWNILAEALVETSL